jgi:hypothetical protein
MGPSLSAEVLYWLDICIGITIDGNEVVDLEIQKKKKKRGRTTVDKQTPPFSRFNRTQYGVNIYILCTHQDSERLRS